MSAYELICNLAPGVVQAAFSCVSLVYHFISAIHDFNSHLYSWQMVYYLHLNRGKPF